MTKAENEISIYHVYPKSTKNAILLAGAMIALLTPFTDTVYLPALKNVAESLKTSDSSVAATVSAYLGAVGAGQLVWGPLADYYGRLPVLFLGLLFYEAFTVGCIFADSINTLIALRTIEGFIVGSSIVTVQAIIADVFAEDERGAAMGAFLTPMLVGPIIAPVIGGVLSQSFNWRATFVLLAIMTVPIFLLAYFVMPETHHFFVVQRIHNTKGDTKICKPKITPNTDSNTNTHTQYESIQKDDNATSHDLESAMSVTVNIKPNSNANNNDTKNSPVVEVELVSTFLKSENELGSDTQSQSQTQIDSNTEQQFQSDFEKGTEGDGEVVRIADAHLILAPQFIMPWEALGFLLELQLAPHYALVCSTFAVMFVSLTTLPLVLAEAPYNMSTSIVGVCYLPVGVAMLLGAMAGGYYSDQSAAKYPNVTEGRLMYSIPTMWMVPVGCIAFGFTLSEKVNLAGPLLTQCVLGFGQATLLPAVLGYLSAARPTNPGAVGSVLFFVCFAGAAVCISISVIISDAIGIQYFHIILGAVCALTCVWSTVDILSKTRASEVGQAAEQVQQVEV